MSPDREVPDSRRVLTRRRFAGALTTSGVVALAGCMGAGSDDDSDNEPDQKDTETDGDESDDGDQNSKGPEKAAMPIDEALSCDTDMTKSFDAHMRLAHDPTTKRNTPTRVENPGKSKRKRDQRPDAPGSGWANGKRRDVVHITSEGKPTQDYPCLTVDLREHNLTLEAITKKKHLTYDYFEGKVNEPAAPGQVFLTLRTTDEKIDKERFWVAYRTADEGNQSKRWRRRFVSKELDQGGWRALEVDSDLIDVDDERVRDKIAAKVIEGKIGELRQQEPFTNLREKFGDDAELLAVTVGTGNVEDSVVLDTYFHNLRVLDMRRPLPAMLTMDPTFKQVDDSIEVTLEFRTDQKGLDIDGGDSVDAESVYLSPYASIARPIDGTDTWHEAVQASHVELVSDTELFVRFPGVLDEFGDAPMVWGAFTHRHDWPLTFLGVRESKWND
jgi:hypothetical protein